MQVIFECQNPRDQCHAMTLLWLARSIEFNGMYDQIPLHNAPLQTLALLQDTYDMGVYLGHAQTNNSAADHDRMALQFFGFDLDTDQIKSGRSQAMAFQPLNHMAVRHGLSYFSIRGFGEGHCLASRAHIGGWDLFDANAGLLRYASDSEFRTGVRQHLLFNHHSQTVGDWVVVPVRGRTQSWAATLGNLRT